MKYEAHPNIQLPSSERQPATPFVVSFLHNADLVDAQLRLS